MKWIIRVTKMVVAPAVVAVSLVAACGSDETGRATTHVESQANAAPSIAERERQLRRERIAEALERQAKYEGHVKTYIDDASEEQPEFLPGSRHMPTR